MYTCSLTVDAAFLTVRCFLFPRPASEVVVVVMEDGVETSIEPCPLLPPDTVRSSRIV